MASTVVVANPDAYPHLALQQVGNIGDFLFVVGFVLPVEAVNLYAVVELPHAEGGEEAHQLDGRPVHERGDAVLLQGADAILDALIVLAVAPDEEGETVGVVVDAVEEVGAEVLACTGDDEYGARAVVGVAVAALVQFDEGLVVAGQFWEADAFEGEGAAGVVEHTVVGGVLPVVSVDMVVKAAPA